MKKLVSLALLLVLALSLIVPAQAGESMKIGVAFATQVAKRFEYDAAYMKEVFDAASAEMIVQWANYEETKQVTQVENMLSQGIDALILVAVNSNMGGLVEKVKAEGIPVVCYDNYIQDAALDAYLDRDNFAGGVMQMTMALEAIGGEGKIVVIHGEPTSSVVKGFKEGYDSVLQKYPSVEVVVEQYCNGYSSEIALEIAENAISAYGQEIKAFVCTADPLALGILPALAEGGLSGKAYVTGMDVETPVLQAIIDGNIGMSIWTDIKECAKRAAEIAVSLVKDEEFAYDNLIQDGEHQIPKVFVPIYAITKENYVEFVDTIAPTDWVTWDDLKLN